MTFCLFPDPDQIKTEISKAIFNKIKSTMSHRTTEISLMAVSLVLLLLIGSSLAAMPEISQSPLEEFRSFVAEIPLQDYQRTDSYLLKWLRASQFNTLLATQKLDNAQIWREENNIDGILNETIPIIPGYIGSEFSMDKHGHPIVTLNMKNVDLRKFIVTGRRDIFLRYNYQILERMAERARIISEITEEDVDQIYIIVDFQGFNKKQHDCKGCLQTLVQLHKDVLTYYPGLRFREVWINTPRTATPLIKAIRALYTKTGSKDDDIKIFNSDRANWAKFLLKDISRDQLTYQFGGTQFDYFEMGNVSNASKKRV
jgi:hypothetical protein